MSDRAEKDGVSQTAETQAETPPSTTTSDSPPVDDTYGYSDDPYAYETNTVPVAQQPAAPPAIPPPPPAAPPEEEDQEEEGMLRMSFLDHLEELRSRIISALMGLVVAFLASLFFCERLWLIVSAPAVDALKQIGVNPPVLAQITPMEVFSTVWMKLPLLTSIFLASPWILYQIWAFVSPGLYKRERRWAAPFIIISSSLFIFGGLFAYFVAFRMGLVFLLGIGRGINIQPLVSVTEYFDLFVNVTLSVGIIFELPVLIFFLTLLHIVSPRFLLEHSRYAILGIIIVAAIITPTTDIVNLTIFSVPMMLLYFVGVLASYVLVLNREKRKFPWRKVALIALAVLLVLGAAATYLAVTRYNYTLVPDWPFLKR